MSEGRPVRGSRRSSAGLAEFSDFSPTEVLFRIRRLAPKKPKRHVGWIVLTGLFVFVVGVATDPSVREWIAGRAAPIALDQQNLPRSLAHADVKMAMRLPGVFSAEGTRTRAAQSVDAAASGAAFGRAAGAAKGSASPLARKRHPKTR